MVSQVEGIIIGFILGDGESTTILQHNELYTLIQFRTFYLRLFQQALSTCYIFISSNHQYFADS